MIHAIGKAPAYEPGRPFGLKVSLCDKSGAPGTRYFAAQGEAGRDDLLAAALEGVLGYWSRTGRVICHLVQELSEDMQIAPGLLPASWLLTVDVRGGDRRKIRLRSGVNATDVVEAAKNSVLKALEHKVVGYTLEVTLVKD